MKTNIIVGIALALMPSLRVISQNIVNTKTVESKELQIKAPETSTEFTITRYKNVDLSKTNALQLEAAGLHSEIYISNTNQGVIIISSTGTDNVLRDFRNNLDLNPTFYESINSQDTTVFFSGNKHIPVFDFTKASSINNTYKNAFNYKVDPRTGVSWEKGSNKFNLKEVNFAGQILYDIIIGMPKYQK